MLPKSSLVTGASRGIGLGIATRLAELGYGLTITARDQKSLGEVAETLLAAGAQRVVAVAANLADRDAAEHITQAHRHEFESMDALILNAGVGTAGSVADYPMHRFDKTLDVNLRAPFHLLQNSIPLLRNAARNNPDRGAKVVALASITGVYAEAGLAVYGAAKAAMMSLVDTLNAEESLNGVNGTSIAPGYVNTDMSDWTKDSIPAETMIEVQDIVQLVTSLLELSSRAIVPRLVVGRAGAGFGA